MKLVTARQAVAVASEVLEAFGGAGYVEDTGLPVLLRDSQVLSIWEGTTNVLSLDVLRALGRDGLTLKLLKLEVARCVQEANEPQLLRAGRSAQQALEHAAAWLAQATHAGQDAVEAGARRFALTLGRTGALALLVRHAQWSLEHERDEQAMRAARRFAQNGVDLIIETV